MSIQHVRIVASLGAPRHTARDISSGDAYLRRLSGWPVAHLVPDPATVAELARLWAEDWPCAVDESGIDSRAMRWSDLTNRLTTTPQG